MKLAGLLSALLIAALTLGAIAVVALRAEGGGALGIADWRALVFTLKQATLSALLSVLLALPLARALSRRRFAGRDLLVTLLGAPFLLPVIVAILGVIAVWGRSGWVSDALAFAGLPRLDIYGMPGVLIAHVFFNLPLAARLMLQALDTIPPERWRVAAQLGLGGGALFKTVEWPALRHALPGALALIFLVCAASFAVALALGGGPRATTLELAIYEAARYDFDLARAARLASVQALICVVAAALALAVSAPPAVDPGAGGRVERWDGAGPWSRLFDTGAIVAVCLFLGAPLLAVAWRGVAGLDDLGADIWAASLRSLGVALGAAAVMLMLCLPLSVLAARWRWLAGIGFLPLAASPFVVGLALLIVLRPVGDPFALALPLTAVVNAVMAAPFALRILAPAAANAEADYGRLADSLGLSGGARFRIVLWPRLRRPVGFAAGLSAALSAGDLGVIALFSTPTEPTLPLLMHILAESRRIDAAYGAAFVLIALCLILFRVCDHWGRRSP